MYIVSSCELYGIVLWMVRLEHFVTYFRSIVPGMIYTTGSSSEGEVAEDETMKLRKGPLVWLPGLEL